MSQRIALCMLVTEPAPDIAKCLESVKPWINSYRIVLSGERACTIWMKSTIHDIMMPDGDIVVPGQIDVSPLEAVTLNEVISLIEFPRPPDYVLVMQPFEVLEVTSVIPTLHADSYELAIQEGPVVRGYQIRLFKPWFRYPINMKSLDESGSDGLRLPGVTIHRPEAPRRP